MIIQQRFQGNSRSAASSDKTASAQRTGNNPYLLTKVPASIRGRVKNAIIKPPARSRRNLPAAVGKRRIRISSIQFPPFSSNLFPADASRDYAAKNRKTLIRLAQILNRFNGSKIKIVGHAVSLLWYDNIRALEEQNEILLPLSRDRANSVRKALSNLGVSADRMSAEGKGGMEPLVPHGDILNRWKNRRVEFVLVEGNQLIVVLVNCQSNDKKIDFCKVFDPNLNLGLAPEIVEVFCNKVKSENL